MKFALGILLTILFAAVPIAAHAPAGHASDAPLTQDSGEGAPRLMRLAGKVKDAEGRPVSGIVGLTIAFYETAEEDATLWLENQNVNADSDGRFVVVVGSATSGGVPDEIFRSGQARWVGIQPHGYPEIPRFLLVSVPYAFKASDADTLQGLPASAFLRAMEGPDHTSGDGAQTSPLAQATIEAVEAVPDFLAKFGSTNTLIPSLVYESDGRIGIGTTNPMRRFSVIGTGDFQVASFESETVANVGVSLRNPQQNWVLGIRSDLSNSFNVRNLTTDVDALIARGDGAIGVPFRLGVGTTNPTAPLHLVGLGDFQLAALESSILGNVGLSFRNPQQNWAIGIRADLGNAFSLRNLTTNADILSISTSGDAVFGRGLTVQADLNFGSAGSGIVFSDGSRQTTGIPTTPTSALLLGGVTPICCANPIIYAGASGSTAGNVASVTLQDTSGLHKFGELAFQDGNSDDIWALAQDPFFQNTEDLRLRHRGQEVLTFTPLGMFGSNVLLTYTGTRMRLERDGVSSLEFRDTSLGLPEGLWRIHNSGNKLIIDKNVAPQGDFNGRAEAFRLDASAAATFSGPRLRLEPTFAATLQFRNAGTSLPDGLWEIVLGSEGLLFRKNTGNQGDFSTHFTAIKLSNGGDVAFPQGKLLGNGSGLRNVDAATLGGHSAAAFQLKSALRTARAPTGAMDSTASADVTIVWASPFEDDGYTVTCSTISADGGITSPTILSIHPNGIVARVRNNSETTQSGVLHCIAVVE